VTPNVVLYCAGDPHFPERAGGGAWAGLAEIAGDSVHALARVVDLCVRDSADLAIPGDIFDGPDPEPGALTPVYAQVRRLADAGLRLFYVLGNHDHGRDWLAPAGPAAVNVSGVVERTKFGHTISGLSYLPTPEAFVAATAAAPRTDFGLYHQAWMELIKSGRYTVTQLPDHGVCVGGDVHVRAVLDKPTHSRRFISTGPLSPQSVAEFNRTAVHAVSKTPAGDFQISEVVLRGREFRRFDVKSPADAETVMLELAETAPDAGLPKELARPFVAIGLDCDVPGFEAAAEALAEKRGVVLRFVARRPVGPGAAADAPVVAAEDLAAAVMSWPGPASPEARDLAAALVAGPDPAAVLAGRWNQYKAAAARGDRNASAPHVGRAE